MTNLETPLGLAMLWFAGFTMPVGSQRRNMLLALTGVSLLLALAFSLEQIGKSFV